MAYLEVPQAKLHVQELGSGPRTVVLVHGLFANMALWYFSFVPALTPEHRVVLYDLRGHGLSTRPASGYGVRAMSQDLGAVIDRSSDGPISLVGFSFGASVAARYACDHPERVETLVLVEPPLPMDLPALEAEVRQMTSLNSLIDGLPEPQRLAARHQRRPSRLVQGTVELVGETSLRSDLQEEPDISDEDLRRISARVMVCYGSDSPIAESGVRARLAALLPEVVQVTLPGSHRLPIDNPQGLTAVVTGFLAGGHRGTSLLDDGEQPS